MSTDKTIVAIKLRGTQMSVEDYPHPDSWVLVDSCETVKDVLGMLQLTEEDLDRVMTGAISIVSASKIGWATVVKKYLA